MSNSLQPHRLQHGRPPCPSPPPEVCPSSCPLHQWCHPTIYPLMPSCPSWGRWQKVLFDILSVCKSSLYMLLLFSRPVVSNSLQPQGLQHVRPPRPSPSPEVCPSSCPLHQWCHPTISSSNASSPAFNLSQHQGLFQWVSCSHQMTQILTPLCFSYFLTYWSSFFSLVLMSTLYHKSTERSCQEKHNLKLHS